MESSITNSVWKLLEELETKQGITEIIINSPTSIFVERGGQLIQLSAELEKDHILRFISDIAEYNNKEISLKYPIFNGNLKDGSRINIITEPLALNCPAISIRKYLKTISSFDSSEGVFNLSPKWITFFKALVKSKMNIIVSGGTGVGKTTFLNLLLRECAVSDRIITIEDTLELDIHSPNLVRLETIRQSFLGLSEDISLGALVKNTLRMRPDRIVIGEVRGGELFDLLQAMNTGHDGSMSSIHANSTAESLRRMETLFLLSGYDVPLGIVRNQIAEAVDFIIHLGRDKNGIRYVQSVMEITGIEGGNILSQVIARSDKYLSLKSSGLAPQKMAEISEDSDLPIDFFGQS